MKKNLFLLFVSLNTILFAQDRFEINSKTYFTRTIIQNIENKTKEELFKKTNEWILKTFASDKVFQSKIDNEFKLE